MVIKLEFLAKKQIPVLPHPPYSPDLAPCDFFYFLRGRLMKGQRFDDVQDMQRHTTQVLKVFTSNGFRGCFQKWEKRWRKCVMLKGDYCEGTTA